MQDFSRKANRFLTVVYGSILLAAGACAAFGAGGKGSVPEDAICAWVDWGGGRRTYICASPSDWTTVNQQAAASRAKAPQ